jgi:hypothetical protein
MVREVSGGDAAEAGKGQRSGYRVEETHGGGFRIVIANDRSASVQLYLPRAVMEGVARDMAEPGRSPEEGFCLSIVAPHLGHEIAVEIGIPGNQLPAMRASLEGALAA